MAAVIVVHLLGSECVERVIWTKMKSSRQGVRDVRGWTASARPRYVALISHALAPGASSPFAAASCPRSFVGLPGGPAIGTVPGMAAVHMAERLDVINLPQASLCKHRTEMVVVLMTEQLNVVVMQLRS